LLWLFLAVSLKITNLHSSPVLLSYLKQGLFLTVKVKVMKGGTRVEKKKARKSTLKGCILNIRIID